MSRQIGFFNDVEYYVEGIYSKDKFIERVEKAASDNKYGDIIENRDQIHNFEDVQDVAQYGCSLDDRKLLKLIEGLDALVHTPAVETETYRPYSSRMLKDFDLKMTPASLLAAETLRQLSMRLPSGPFLDKSFPGTEKWGLTRTNAIKEFYKGQFNENTYMYDFGQIDYLLAKEVAKIEREIEYPDIVEKRLNKAKRALSRKDCEASSLVPATQSETHCESSKPNNHDGNSGFGGGR
ncbi:MAG: hypothetical protein IJ870_02695 [Alphaproteobacteria bacterium]|nr:hypothetical protein [Alphaproteobacteria bacterium]